ncbi:MAG TPA: DNA-directed RNA polymerase subunit beta [Candidatus Omnitrophica bacterium]|nr:MAG: DNA-directed RNA polymerase subunit beta [Candidatus Omnitrophota bacterium]RKY43757.1 MAG: DNA-directed RNA polymerase subunit beta [Candidatus Omnitrophota bacterium]HEC69102.1 DNA-directed RNA polymerase subunit beta [Candidatus Omnitrophota bacterium]
MKTISFARIKTTHSLPNLLEHQLKSYRDFLQMDVSPEKRKNIGLQEVLKEIFPLESPDGKWRLEYISYNLGRPKYTMEECKRRSLTYGAPLRLRLRLVGEEEVREQEIYFGDIPLITPVASFIINGDERVVVSQLQRSPGVYFEEESHPSGKKLYFARIIPYRGSWLEFRYDINETLSAIIDRRRTFLATQVLRMFGLSTNEDIFSSFSERRYTEIVNTLKRDYTKNTEEALLEFYKKLRPTEPLTLEVAREVFRRMFQDNRRYDLAKVGRFVLNRKLKMDYSLNRRTLDKETVVNIVKHLIKVKQGELPLDDIDHLSNRRVKLVGELVQHEVRVGLLRVERLIMERFAFLSSMKEISIQHLINARVFSSQIHDFFARSPLCQFMDQVNPLAEITHKRRLSALGPGGLSRERAGFEVRDVHPSHYGRICPIETPEGQNIGLISSLTTYATINPLGFITTPYRKIEKGFLTGKTEYLTADEEEEEMIIQASPNIEDSKIKDEFIYARFKGKFPKVKPTQARYMDVSPKQIVSVSASLIPFLEHDDANRALMGSNMQRQAIPLLFPEAPLVATGMETKVAKDSGAVLLAEEEGVVEKVDSSFIKIGKLTYHLKKFQRSNADTCINQRPLVKPGDKVRRGEAIADGPATKEGRLSLGRNLLVGFLPWRGYNFEDAILISERLVKEDILTSVHIERFEVEARETRLGNEEITRDLPNVSEEALKNLDEQGIVRIGARVLPDDILVGKVTPKTEKELTPEDRLLRAIFGEKAADVRDTSLRVPPGVEGVVTNVEVFQRKEKGRKSKKEKTEELRRLREIEEYYSQELEIIEQERVKRIAEFLNISLNKARNLDLSEYPQAKDISAIYEERINQLIQEKELEISKIKRGDELPSGVLKRVVVYVAMKRKIAAGDKLAGRHGNKGVIAKILPEEDMPFLEDGTPLDVVLNPLGVPSRMNVGQVLETHLGWAAKSLGIRIEAPVFEGAREEEIRELLRKANLPEDGKTVVYDGFTGKPFSQKVTVGYMYIMKLIHMVEDKIHARAIGPYSLITQQPLGGKAQFGGQRFGEMEVWALEAYGASFTLQEMLTVKSDDVQGRTRIYEAIVKGEHKFHPSVPESFNVLMKELQGLCIEVKIDKKER